MPAPLDSSRQRGIVLLVALLTIALLTMTVMEFTFTTQVDYRRAAHWLQAQQATLAAESGIALGEEILAQSELLYGLMFMEKKTADGLAELWAQMCAPDSPGACPSPTGPMCLIDTGAGKIAVRITDESGLYNLNRLAKAGQPSAERERDVFRRIVGTIGVDPAVIGPIADWVDRDDRQFPFAPGAEAAVYGGLSRLYGPRNAPLQTFGELALVEGISPNVLVRLRRVTTVLDPRDGTTININTAPLELLGALDPQVAAVLPVLAEERCRKPFASVEDLRRRVPDWPRWLGNRWLHVRSRWFRIRATGIIDEVRQSAEALVRREDDSIRVVYYLTRRGVIIPGVEAATVTNIDDIQSGAPNGRELQ